MKKLMLFSTLLGLLVFSISLQAKTVIVKLGQSPVKIILEQHHVKRHAKFIVHVHENETTALQAARAYIHQKGGRLLTLEHGGTRNIVFHLHHVRYEFDPNRIFTDRGIKRTLKQFGHYSRPAHSAVRRLARRILGFLPPGKVIAVHNNRDYSLQNYLPHHPLAADARAINFHVNSNKRNFYFVTRLRDYQRFEKRKFNVVLQARHAQNDGSLSYYLRHHQYINIEAAYGELKPQLRMLYDA